MGGKRWIWGFVLFIGLVSFDAVRECGGFGRISPCYGLDVEQCEEDDDCRRESEVCLAIGVCGSNSEGEGIGVCAEPCHDPFLCSLEDTHNCLGPEVCTEIDQCGPGLGFCDLP